MTRRIEKLTAAQTARMPEIAARWIAYGVSTAPADRPVAEAAMRLAYESGNVPWHGNLVWCESPLSLVLTDSILRDRRVRASVGASVWDSVRASVWDSVRASVGDSVGDSVWDSVRDSVRASVGDSVWDS